MDGLEFKLLRIRCGLTQHQLAKLAGLWQGRISDFEKGVLPVPDQIVEILQQELAASGAAAR